MTPAIMLSFVVPALVAVTLTVLLIKEKDYLFNKKNTYNIPKRRNISERPYSKKSDNNKNDQTHIDYSGGLMGL